MLSSGIPWLLVVLGLTALCDSISVYIGPSPLPGPDRVTDWVLTAEFT